MLNWGPGTHPSKQNILPPFEASQPIHSNIGTSHGLSNSIFTQQDPFRCTVVRGRNSCTKLCARCSKESQHGTSNTIKIATLSLLNMPKYYNIGYTLAILKFTISTNRTLLGVQRPGVATSTQQSWLETQKWPSASSQQTKLTYRPLSSAIYNIGTNWCDLH